VARIVAVGAGVAGLLAAHELRAAGHDVVLVDKGHVPGGRLATRHVDAGTFDTGAQFLTAKSPRFAEQVGRWVGRGTAGVWFHGSPDHLTPTEPDGHPRYRGRPTMRVLALDLARGLDVHLGTVVEHIEVADGGVTVHGSARTDDGALRDAASAEFRGEALLLTPPLPQVLALLGTSRLPLPTDLDAGLRAIAYDPCLAVLAVPAGPTSLPARGGMRLPEGPVGWLTDNRATGASSAPAVTIHGAADISRELWDASDAEVGRTLVEAARPYLGTDARTVHVHRWRYAAPTSRWHTDAVLETSLGVPIAIAGDGLVGGRVEGAALSGWAAADALVEALPEPVAA
jgi:renalase